MIMHIKLKIDNVKKCRHLIVVLTVLNNFFCLGCVEAGNMNKDSKTKIEHYNHSESRVRELIKIGDSYEKVLKLLGKPNHDDLMMEKNGRKTIGRRLMYIYEQKDKAIFNQKTDRYLRLWFGSDDLLLEIDYHEGSEMNPRANQQR